MEFNKFKKFYSPIPHPVPTPVEDDSLSKNYTDDVDARKTYTSVTNVEKYFAAMAGDEIEMPTPRNAMEYQMKRAAENIQNGSSGGGAPFVITFSGDSFEHTAACDKTWAEIYAAYTAGRQMVVRYDDGSILYTCNTNMDIGFGDIGCVGGTFLMYRPYDGDLLSANCFIDTNNEPSVRIDFTTIK